MGSGCELKVKLVGAVHHSGRGLEYDIMARVLRGTLFYHGKVSGRYDRYWILTRTSIVWALQVLGEQGR